MHFENFITQLTHQLKQPLPGATAHEKMIHNARRYANLIPPDNARKSAILIAFYPFKNQIYIPLILRPPYDGTHGGQMAFPGGRMEDDDESLERTALREAQEEIGIKAIDIKVIGQLTEIYIPPSNFIVQPIVGFLNYRPDFYPDPIEVDKIFEININELCDNNAIENRKIKVRGLWLETPGYAVANQWIWGASALMLAELIEVINQFYTINKPTS